MRKTLRTAAALAALSTLAMLLVLLGGCTATSELTGFGKTGVVNQGAAYIYRYVDPETRAECTLTVHSQREVGEAELKIGPNCEVTATSDSLENRTNEALVRALEKISTAAVPEIGAYRRARLEADVLTDTSLPPGTEQVFPNMSEEQRMRLLEWWQTQRFLLE